MSKGIGGVISNPIVWGGGALLGLAILLRGNPTTAGMEARATTAVDPAYLGAVVQTNTVAMGTQVELARISAEFGAAKFNANVADHANFYSYMKNLDNNNTVLAMARAEANAGITNSLISSSTAIIIDQANNMARLGMAWQETARAEIMANRDIRIAEYSYMGQKAAAKANMIGEIAGAVGGVASMAISAATGVPMPSQGLSF